MENKLQREELNTGGLLEQQQLQQLDSVIRDSIWTARQASPARRWLSGVLDTGALITTAGPAWLLVTHAAGGSGDGRAVIK